MYNLIKKSVVIAYWLVGIACFMTQANATETTVGIVSSMDGNVHVVNNNGRVVDFGDDLLLNDKIEIGAKSSLVLTYYAECRQEWYDENTIIEIGQQQSNVIKGNIKKVETFDCEVPSVVLSGNDSFKKAAFHFRGISQKESAIDTTAEAIAVINKNKVKSQRVDNNKHSSDDVKLKMWTAKKDDRYYQTGEHIIIYFVANKDAYLNLNYYQADGNVVHLIPNLFEDKYHIKAGQIYIVGGNKSKLKLIVEHPYGEETISALVSSKPFPKDFKTIETIETTEKYKQKLSKSLTAHNKVAEYSLGIWSRP